MIVTSLRPVQAECFELCIDGEPRLTLHADLIWGAGLHVGDEITAGRLGELENEEQLRRAREAAAHLLSFRARSEAELRRRLARKGFSPEIVEECLSSTRRLGLVDDAAFSESFVRDRVRLRPRGRRSLAGELRARGVEPETAREAIASVFLAEGVSEVELACLAAAKWSPRAGEDPRKARARLQGLLVRRGFTSDAVREAARSRLAELGTDAEEHSL